MLALSLFDLLAPLALKVATTEPKIDSTKQTMIHQYFVKEWGYDPEFTSEGIKYTASKLNGFSIDELTQALAEFAGRNRDCNFRAMSQEILGFLRNIGDLEGQVNSPEAMAVDRIEAIFKKANKRSFRRKAQAGWISIKKIVNRVVSKSRLNQRE